MKIIFEKLFSFFSFWFPKINGSILSLFSFLSRLFTNGQVWVFWIVSNSVLFFYSLFKGGAGALGGIINNFFITILDRVGSEISDQTISQMIENLDPRLFGLLGYLGVIEALNIISLGLTTMLSAYIGWVLILTFTKVTIKAVRG